MLESIVAWFLVLSLIFVLGVVALVITAIILNLMIFGLVRMILSKV